MMNLNNRLKMNAFFYLPICLFFSLLISCGTVPSEENVPPNFTPSELNQKAQEELDEGRVRNALAYYRILVNRYGQDMSVRTGAEYEIAHIYIKQKKWVEADDILKTILNRYEAAGGATLPPKYYILVKKDYARTREYLTKKNGKKKNEEKKTE